MTNVDSNRQITLFGNGTSQLKRCSKCKRLVNKTNFSKDKNHKDDLRSQCKDCTKKYNQRLEVKDRARKRNERRHATSQQAYDERTNNTKICMTCRRKLNVNNFWRGIDKDGLTWYCKDCMKDSRKEYRQHPEVKARTHASHKKWREENKEYLKEYHQRPEVKKKHRTYMGKYNHRPDVEARGLRYRRRPEIKARNYKNSQQWFKNNPKRTKELRRRIAGKRRQLGYILLWPNPFPDDIDVEYHHVIQGIPFVIPIPGITHNFVSGNAYSDAHWTHNKQWINDLYQLDIDSLILDEGGCVLSC